MENNFLPEASSQPTSVQYDEELAKLEQNTLDASTKQLLDLQDDEVILICYHNSGCELHWKA